MAFSKHLIDKINNKRPNSIIIYIMFSIYFNAIIAFFIIGSELKLDMVSFILLMFFIVSLLIVILLIRICFPRYNRELGKIENFVILHSDEINYSEDSHEEILTLITDLDKELCGSNACGIINKLKTFFNPNVDNIIDKLKKLCEIY